jgi:diguanylate cyclase (GGDEF)-like protein/PAS domain S-box-containing protein
VGRATLAGSGGALRTGETASSVSPSAQSDSSITDGMRRAIVGAAVVFVLALGIAVSVVWVDRDNHFKDLRQQATLAASSQVNLIQQRLGGEMSTVYALAVVLRQHSYKVSNYWFEPFASELIRYHPGISSLQYAPNGITTYIVPMAGNERAVGNNLLLNNKRNKEALLAISTKRLTISGPFELVQGGVGLVGRLPVFQSPGPDGEDESFWGFAVALVKVDELLRASEIDRLERAGYDYTLWRVHPDNGEPHVFSRSGPERLPDAITLSLPVPNGEWFLSLQPKPGWEGGRRVEFQLKYLSGFVLSLLAAWIAFALLRQPVLLRSEVAARTRELSLANAALAEENRVRAEAEAKLRLSAKVIATSAEAIMITDERQAIVAVNEAFSRMTGYSETEVLGRSPALLASGRHEDAYFQAMFESLKRDGHWQGEVWNRRKNGEVFPQWTGISVLRDESGKITHYVSISSDITERKASEERIHYLAHYDTLTGLPNRLLLRDRTQLAMSAAERGHCKVALLSLDLDRFKMINDSFGHQVGDELLKQVVGRLKSAVRSSDTISRQGGDEFIIVLADRTETPSAAKVASKIQEQLAIPFMCAGQELRVTSSIGIALYPDDGTDFETLLKKCDIAMYHAKESGRATYRFYTDALNANSQERLQLETELRWALERQEFVLYYQPQIELDSGRVAGAEALIRWRHPVKGMVPPGRFIPLAEETGLIVALDEWVMKEACRQAVAWRASGIPLHSISVNLSGLQFRQTDLVGRVRATLAESGLPPECLELELTESILVHDVENVLSTVEQLKAIGVKLAIDDFGTGYSSLAYLKRFAVDKLKIDQSFVRGTDVKDAAIVQAVIQLGKSLNLRTIAEGAETHEQVQTLRDKGCFEVQGYYFSKPLPAELFAAFVERSLVEGVWPAQETL